MRLVLTAFLLCCTLAGGGSAAQSASAAAAVSAAPPAANQPDSATDARVAILKILPPGSKLDDLRPSPIAGLYELVQGAEVSYITADGKYFVDGNLYDMKSRENLTEQLRTRARIAMIGAVPESEMLIFSPPNPQYTITVFTDVDCQYCRKLHGEMQELNRLGIRVRYLFYPRTGPNTESWHKAEVVWCSPNRNDALTRAKLGQPLDMNNRNCSTPVKREYELGQSLGVNGTPAIVTENGEYIAGYLPPRDLLARIKQLQVANR